MLARLRKSQFLTFLKGKKYKNRINLFVKSLFQGVKGYKKITDGWRSFSSLSGSGSDQTVLQFSFIYESEYF